MEGGGSPCDLIDTGAGEMNIDERKKRHESATLPNAFQDAKGANMSEWEHAIS